MGKLLCLLVLVGIWGVAAAHKPAWETVYEPPRPHEDPAAYSGGGGGGGGETDEKLCKHWAMEFYLVYDISASFKNDAPVLREIAPELFRALATEYPGARFGIGVFSDKPVGGYGQKDGICYMTEQGLTTNQKDCVDVFKRVKHKDAGDHDAPESSLDAMYHGLMSATVGWTSETHDSDGRPIVRVIIVSTDAVPHQAGDAYKVDKKFIPHPGDPEPQCKKYDYPTEELIRQALNERGAQVIFLIADKSSLLRYYWDFLDRLGVLGTVLPLADDSSDIIDVLLPGLDEITELACASTPPPIPTPPPPVESTVPVPVPDPATTVTETTTTTHQTTTTATGSVPPVVGGGAPVGVIVGAASAGVVVAIAGAGAGVYKMRQPPKDPLDLDFEPDQDDEPLDRDVPAVVEAEAFS